MSEPHTDTRRGDRHGESVAPRYRFLKLKFETEAVGIIQDLQNENAWIQSSVYMHANE
ncbi:hypothetical protein [Haloarchaeobius sp. TZWSO28]|uniref:hypothetical protein n=1 Tax=Haloarchaeobius sp. TZWSO28 TaxID=3446119 RepID=UPI003EBBDDC1